MFGWRFLKGKVMICRRRVLRNPVLFLSLVFLIGMYIFIKTGPVYSEWFLRSRDFTEDSPTHSRTSDLDGLTLAEVERLNLLQNSQLDSQVYSNNELMKKFNESIVVNAEEDDPFNEKHKNTFVDFINFNPNFKDTDYTPEQLRPFVDDVNKRQLLYNVDKYTNLPAEHAVIVIQVHKRIEYFKELLDSLQRAIGIENVVLVISHDYYSDIMNALIRKITFCQVCCFFSFYRNRYHVLLNLCDLYFHWQGSHINCV